MIIHPVRFQILRVLGREHLTTQEISERLPAIPKSSIYRHLKLLLDGEIIAVAETRLVNGIQEKSYQLQQAPSLGPADVAELTADDHIRLFSTYALLLIKDFSSYLAAAEAQKGAIDFVADRVGYREVTFYATPAELDKVLMGLNQAIRPLIQNGPAAGRRQLKLATILHPFRDG